MRLLVAIVAVSMLGCSREEPIRAERVRALPPEPSWSAFPAPIPHEPPSPSPTPSPGPKLPPPFDRDAARKALAAVSYKHCKLARSVRVIVRFQPTGHAVVDKVGTADPLPATTELCLITTFEKATVPEFDGEPVTVAVLAR